jgi:hypothetical protein
MKQFEKNYSVMEARNHSKNGANLKSHTFRKSLRFALLIVFSITGFSLFSQVSEYYKHNPYVRDSKEVAELKNNIEITGNNCDKDSYCSELFVKNKTSDQFGLLIEYRMWKIASGSKSDGGGNYAITLNPNETRKVNLPSREGQGFLAKNNIYIVTSVSLIPKTENLKFSVEKFGNKQVYNGIEFGSAPFARIIEEDNIFESIKQYKIYFDMLVIDDLGNKQVVSKSEIVTIDQLCGGGRWGGSWLQSMEHEYIKQYNYSTFWAKPTRIDIAD